MRRRGKAGITRKPTTATAAATVEAAAAVVAAAAAAVTAAATATARRQRSGRHWHVSLASRRQFNPTPYLAEIMDLVKQQEEEQPWLHAPPVDSQAKKQGKADAAADEAERRRLAELAEAEGK